MSLSACGGGMINFDHNGPFENSIYGHENGFENLNSSSNRILRMKRISIKPDAEVTPRINYANSSSIVEDSNHVQHISLPHADEIENAV